MSRYIDADAVIEELRQIYHDCDDWKKSIGKSDAIKFEKLILLNRANATKTVMIEVRLRVDKIPTADVVEVVRCRECKYWNYKKLMCECPEWTDMDGWHKATDADDYCFRAERKEKRQ